MSEKTQDGLNSNFESNNKGKIKKFWSPYNKTNGRPSYEIDRALLSDYLKVSGYRRLSSFEDNQIVQLIDNVAYEKTSFDIYRDLLNIVEREENSTLRSCYIEQGENLILSKKAILTGLPIISLERYKDTKKVVTLFFKNCIVKINDKGVYQQTYKQFRKKKKYITASKIIKRNFALNNGLKSDFRQLLKLITNDTEHFKSICATIGYLLSSYKNPSLAKAVIITDILSQAKNEAYGRSGKGLIIKALSNIINVVEYNGKVTDLTNDKFVFQNINYNTDIIVIQDVTKGFLFESLFSTLTDNMSVERKHRSKISIPFSDSPKVALTTNYTIPQETDSFKDRKHMLTLNNYFNAKNKPEKHFKKLLFDWNDKQWKWFDNFMVQCIQLFLIEGLLAYDSTELKMQKLIKTTSKEFVELMEEEYDVLNSYFSLRKIAALVEVGTNEPRSKGKIISKWVESYAAYKGYKVDKRQSGGMVKKCFLKSV